VSAAAPIPQYAFQEELAMKWKTFMGYTAAATLCATLTLVAQDKKDAGAPPPEVLARMMPGPMHKKLEPLIGSWTATGKWRMAPDAPWQEFTSTAERKWILDGRFIEERVKSEMMGQPFEGIGLIGYDNVRQEFTMVWLDNMGTGTWVSTGKADGSKFTFEGTTSDPMTGEKNMWTKSVLDISTPQHTLKGFAKDPAGKEFTSMEMTMSKK
jgi:hypothetical protein